MIDAYLEDETLKSYVDVIERNKAEGAAAAKKEAVTKPVIRSALSGGVTKPGAAAQAPEATPSPAVKPPAKPKADPTVPF
jgi:hypothetical protein